MRTRGFRAASLGGAALAASLLGGCTEPGLVVVNGTDESVQILTTRDPSVLVTELRPHETKRIGISSGGDGCNPDVGWSAYHPAGAALSTLGKACQGDTWTIR